MVDMISERDLVPQVSRELSLPERNVRSTLALLQEGNTIPFIARYRKEATGSFDEVQIEAVKERYDYLLDMDKRRETVLATIEKQGKLTDELTEKIMACATKTELEDLYLPFKPKRRTRAMIAREKGLEPLADRILAQPPQGDPLADAQAFVDGEAVPDSEAALAGARDIVAEVMAEDARVRAQVRKVYAEQGEVVSDVELEHEDKPSKFEQYYHYRERVSQVPSHRYLAIQRGEREGVLRARIEVNSEPVLPQIHDLMGLREGSPFAPLLRQAVQDGYRRLLAPSIEKDVRSDVALRSDQAAVRVFAENLHHLLMAPPLGGRPVVGIDPGLRTGCKCAAVDGTGTYLGSVTVYLFKGQAAEEQAKVTLMAFIDKYNPEAIAVGNGTGGRETEALVRQLLVDRGRKDIVLVAVSEAGASVYSASEVAREEFPDLDLTVRGAISIARRLQDPLAELVKIDPKAIGVGQYQHDVDQSLLKQRLESVVESCVNQVGVELNTASVQLLAYVAGIGPSVARKIVAHRDGKGAFTSRKELLKVSGLGPRTFEQSAGFLRIRNAAHPLDASAVHPERYSLVEQMGRDLGVPLTKLVGNEGAVKRIDIGSYVQGDVGEPTLRDIVSELMKPGRDPRQSFEPPRFRDDVHTPEDLKVGMELEGVVTNVTDFGAFVDVGVHRDGLVHISQLADRFVRDPREVVKVGQKIKVWVMEVDLVRKRISLTARTNRAKGE